jgi:hypothetical protein
MKLLLLHLPTQVTTKQKTYKIRKLKTITPEKRIRQLVGLNFLT